MFRIPAKPVGFHSKGGCSVVRVFSRLYGICLIGCLYHIGGIRLNKTKAQKLLKIKDLRFFQHCLISALVHDVDIMCFMPTSAGKSIIYQMTSLMLEELVLVIEPHLALELDQVRQLQERGISAACLNSLTSSSNRKEIL